MVRDLIVRAKRRYALQESFAEIALAASFAIAGVSLLLIFGTAYLDWWSVLLLGVAGLVYGIWRVGQRIPSEYAMAVRLDQSAGLHDALSTAIYFENHGDQGSGFRTLQSEQARALAGAVELHSAVPFKTPKALYAMAALSLIATGLFAVRYHFASRLDLRAPLTRVLFEDQEDPALGKPKDKAAQAKNKKKSGVQSLLAKLGVSLNQEETKAPDALDRAVEEALKAPGAAAEGDQKGQAPGAASKDGKASATRDDGRKGDPLDSGQPDQNGKDADPNAQTGDKDSNSGDQGKKDGNAGDNGSLVSKLKDAVSNILAKAKQDSNSSGQKGGQQQGGQQSAKSDKSAGEKGKTGQAQQQGEQQASSQEADPNGDSQEGQQAQGKSGTKDSNQQASSQPGSGIGHQDGAKDLKASEQLKAMGKLSEIIGRRAQTMSGETSIEVQSGSQQLKTAYSKSGAAHGETDGDVNRDEVPVALQNYVQQYFHQIRKTGEATAVKQRAEAGSKKKIATP